MKRLCLFWAAWSSLAVYVVFVNRVEVSRRLSAGTRCSFDRPEDFQGFDNISGTRDGCYIVPNIVHFVRFGQPEFSFVDAICVLAALKNQKPDKMYFHTDLPNFFGRHWKVILSTPGVSGVIELKYMPVPEQKYHAREVTILQILMKYGGIYLNNTYIVRSLNEFRRFEMTIGWQPGEIISNQVIVAHKNARVLREWLSTYNDHYEEVLTKHPELVHRVSRRLAESTGIDSMLYLDESYDWVDHYAIHLAPETVYPVVFDEDNIRSYHISFKDMACYVYPINQTV